MKITEVRIFQTESRDGKLKAFATMTIDDWFVVRNVKIIQGNTGLFIAMPSRKAMDPCNKCGHKNVRGSKYCNQCGKEQPRRTEHPAEESPEKTGDHMDIAHPITQECRLHIQKAILEAYDRETGRERSETAGKKEKAESKEPAGMPERTEERREQEKEKPVMPDLKVDAGQDIEL